MWLVTAHGRAAGGCVEGTDRNELICREEQFLFQREYRNLFEIHFGAGFVLQSDIAGLRSGAPIGSLEFFFGGTASPSWKSVILTSFIDDRAWPVDSDFHRV